MKIPLLLILIGAFAATTSAETTPASAEPVITSEDARVELTRLLREDGRTAEAIAEYQKLIAALPDRADIRVELAELQNAAGQPEAAEKTLAGLDWKTFDEKGRLLVANLAVQRKDWDQAIAILREITADKPQNLKVRFQLAQVLSWSKHYDESLAEYRQLVEARPRDVQLRRHYARVLGWAGRREEALAQWKQSLEVTSPSP